MPRAAAFTLGLLVAAVLMRRLWRELLRPGRGYYQLRKAGYRQSTIEPQ